MWSFNDFGSRQLSKTSQGRQGRGDAAPIGRNVDWNVSTNRKNNNMKIQGNVGSVEQALRAIILRELQRLGRKGDGEGDEEATRQAICRHWVSDIPQHLGLVTDPSKYAPVFNAVCIELGLKSKLDSHPQVPPKSQTATPPTPPPGMGDIE